MSRIKSLVMTYRDHDLSTLAKAYFTNEELAKLYKSYDSLVALETCNRIELYLDGDEDEGGLIELIYEKAGIKPRLLYDLDAVKHLLLVTAGLDSMFLGEREILSQVKRAYAMSKPSPRLRILFESAIRFGESFRRRHDLNEVSFVKFLSDYIMGSISRDSNVLIVGGGEVARGVVRELLRNGYRNITIINRTTDKLKYEFKDSVRLLGLEALINELISNKYDALVVAVSVQSPLITINELTNHSPPKLMIDVSTPSAINVQGNGHVRVIKLEDLREPYLEYVNGRSKVMNELLEIDNEAERIMRLIMRSDADEIIRSVMRFIEEIREEEVSEALRVLRGGESVETVIDDMSRSLVKKIMHNYLENMRKFAEAGEEDMVRRLRDYLMEVLRSNEN
ncbi:NAD(P)-binding domain-containing protein [Vulcanisaeta souniana]|uniref:Glutamyl-tRNA reductase n=2 Tax=Vulcanisaeta souniana TaxID=164452 RepID=A0A830EEL1_9CREN|nr:NAD(P)-binding domain-containing protein [Vulcanisaeta souniana]BDR93516.1 glutamyl-tRNA reductase [Vulcanisaeta souniana JCM 11219]GGI77767.1 glutamyl-tRNA reductase [Vulcanisaeta souniana JCM 11219]